MSNHAELMERLRASAPKSEPRLVHLPPPPPPLPRPSFYLAGRITRFGWRDDLRQPAEPADDSNKWPRTTPMRVGAGCCTGPFFMTQLGNHAGDTEYGHNTVERCLEAIRRCDVVFCWLEPEAYGTIFELGYAKALGKKIVVACASFMSDTWFATRNADTYIEAPTPREAFEQYVATLITFDSPIEKAFYDALPSKPAIAGFTVKPQFEVNAAGGPRLPHEAVAYRLDFAFIKGDVRICVECDGHDFHERTKEQAAHDRKRDRALTIAGWMVLRFTGSEIHRDVKSCVGELLSVLQR